MATHMKIFLLVSLLAKRYLELETPDMPYGPLHIIVEDGNMSDKHLEMCKRDITSEEDMKMIEFLEIMPERLREIVWNRAVYN